MNYYKPATFHVPYKHGSYRREGCVAVLIPNTNIQITSENIQDIMPHGFECETFLENTVTFEPGGLIYQIVKVKVKGWADYVKDL
jgi:hypothetical protein